MSKTRTRKFRKRISQKEFDRKVKFWNILIPIVVCVITSLTSIGIAVFSPRPPKEVKVEQKITEVEQIEVNHLAQQIEELSLIYYRSRNETEKKKLDATLTTLANQEAHIMRKYVPEYWPRWPQPGRPSSGQSDGVPIAGLIVGIVGLAAMLAIIGFMFFAFIQAFTKPFIWLLFRIIYAVGPDLNHFNNSPFV